MAAIDDLIKQVEDEVLRERLKQESKRLTKDKTFGLVFEDHLPEITLIYNLTIQKGDKVAKSDGKIDKLWRVDSIRKNLASCINIKNGVKEEFHLKDLVVVKQFGQPIFPSLVSIDSIQNGDDDAPWHTLIEADNYHALQLLEYLYPEQVDCIYIDPPYNTGARDWKYNNDYVDTNDHWRHSKWLAMMKRRLKLAKTLLNPNESVLFITIDDNELHTLSLLLDQVFPGCERQLITITINPKGKSRDGRLSQVDEYIIVTYLGKAQINPLKGDGVEKEIRWRYLRRNDMASKRGTVKGGKNQFYPIYIDTKSHKIVKIGDPISPEQSIDKVQKVSGAIPVFPINDEGVHMNWGLIGKSLEEALKKGFVRVTKGNSKYQPYVIAALTWPNIKKVEEGVYQLRGERPDGSKIVVIPGGKESRPTTVWKNSSHDAGAYGTSLIRQIVPNREFTFPKSLYAVEDTLRLFLGNKKNAIVLDFFAGSGTTAHAVMRLNQEDNGKRRCISVTNNEVSEKEATELTQKGFNPLDEQWKKMGICQSITWPRCKFAIKGKRDDGTKLEDEYISGGIVEKDIPRNFHQINFTSLDKLNTTLKKKQLVSFLNGIPQSVVKKDSAFIISDKSNSTILFDILKADMWIDELEALDHMTTFYIVTDSIEKYTEIKLRIEDLLGPIRVFTEERYPMSAGFRENMEYFRLDFLDKNHVALGNRFKEILPLLWLKSGAIGRQIKYLRKYEKDGFLIADKSNFAVLMDESKLPEFRNEIKSNRAIENIFIVTDSEESFREMGEILRVKKIFQLYRDYLENFMINIGDDL